MLLLSGSWCSALLPLRWTGKSQRRQQQCAVLRVLSRVLRPPPSRRWEQSMGVSSLGYAVCAWHIGSMAAPSCRYEPVSTAAIILTGGDEEAEQAAVEVRGGPHRLHQQLRTAHSSG